MGCRKQIERGGRYDITEAAMEEAIGRRRDMIRHGRMVIIRERINLCICSRNTEIFATTSGANQFEDLFNKSESKT